MRVQFANRFVADLETGELFLDGRLKALYPQPFLLLSLLLKHPKRCVSYDQIRQQLWPDTHVGQGSVKEAAARVRCALGQDARRLQCLRNRGYRLMVSTVVVSLMMASSLIAQTSPAAPGTVSTGPMKLVGNPNNTASSDFFSVWLPNSTTQPQCAVQASGEPGCVFAVQSIRSGTKLRRRNAIQSGK